jgi:SAM-dependent methyltransferase
VSADHFSAVARDYGRYRPSYPAALFAALAQVAPACRAAWDCATGTGQAALGLAQYFARVVATDLSPPLVRAAPRHPRVGYVAARAEASPLPAGWADLVTVAQALHWLDLPAFYDEARRVLAPGGVLAVWTYDTVRLELPGLDAAVQRLYRNRLRGYWPAERALVETGYRSLPFPFAPVEAPRVAMTAQWSRAELLGYLRTWSATERFRAARGVDPIALAEPEIAAAWPGDRERVGVRWPLTVRLGRR